jgi:hypothetical protein
VKRCELQQQMRLPPEHGERMHHWLQMHRPWMHRQRSVHQLPEHWLEVVQRL